MKTLAKKWLSPALIERLKPFLVAGIYFSGDYTDWEIASVQASGYDSVFVLEQVEHAMLKVKAGEAVFERDSVLFDEVQHSFPVPAGLLRAAVENGNQFSVLNLVGRW